MKLNNAYDFSSHFLTDVKFNFIKVYKTWINHTAIIKPNKKKTSNLPTVVISRQI